MGVCVRTGDWCSLGGGVGWVSVLEMGLVQFSGVSWVSALQMGLVQFRGVSWVSVSELGLVHVRDTIQPFVYKNWAWCSLDQR